MKILILEDEEKLRRLAALHLEGEGHECMTFATAEDALPHAADADLILTDLRLPGMDGLSFLDRVRQLEVEAPVIVMTAFGNIDVAVAAMKQGALDFLQKPFSLDHLSAVVAKAGNLRSLQSENRQLKEQLTERYQFHNLIGRSEGMQEVFRLVERAAPSRSTILICGESGVGKDMVARAIHWHSPRRGQPMVKINCSALPENLMESELFGYERGAFTGATVAKPGKFEQAHGGTVFLDEIGDVPLPVQVKLLRVLQEREFERLGSNRTQKIDVRVIAATNVDLRAALEQGRFREDLYYRLNVLPINVPPLRERPEDIVPLAKHFLAKFGAADSTLRPDALEKLMAHSWPGNVRELENVMERSLLLAEGKTLSAADIRIDLAPKRQAGPGEVPFLPPSMTLDEFERSIIREALRRAQGNKSQAARLLGITRNALRYRLGQMGESDVDTASDTAEESA